MLAHYRRLLAERRASPALQHGSLQRLQMPEGVLAFTRECGEDRRTVVVNFRESDVEVDVGGEAMTVPAETAAVFAR